MPLVEECPIACPFLGEPYNLLKRIEKGEISNAVSLEQFKRLETMLTDHSTQGEERYQGLAKRMDAHNGYIRENQAFQNKILGGMLVIGAMSGLAAAFSILARVS